MTIDQRIDQITAALKKMDESDGWFMDQIYTMIHLHIDRKEVAMSQREGNSYDKTRCH